MAIVKKKNLNVKWPKKKIQNQMCKESEMFLDMLIHVVLWVCTAALALNTQRTALHCVCCHTTQLQPMLWETPPFRFKTAVAYESQCSHCTGKVCCSNRSIGALIMGKRSFTIFLAFLSPCKCQESLSLGCSVLECLILKIAV